METQTFVYIVEHCSQDASTVMGITEHVLRTLKEDSADVAEAFVRQDNAGCYHDTTKRWWAFSPAAMRAASASASRILLFEECDLQERAPLLDRAKRLSHHKLLEGASQVISSEYHLGETSATSSLTRDWALKTTKSSRRFNEAQRNYLGEKVQIGQHTGHGKLDLTVVARNMRNAKKSDGTRLFQPDERRRHRSKLTFRGKPRHCATITMLTVTTKGLRERIN